MMSELGNAGVNGEIDDVHPRGGGNKKRSCGLHASARVLPHPLGIRAKERPNTLSH